MINPGNFLKEFTYLMDSVAICYDPLLLFLPFRPIRRHVILKVLVCHGGFLFVAANIKSIAKPLGGALKLDRAVGWGC